MKLIMENWRKFVNEVDPHAETLPNSSSQRLDAKSKRTRQKKLEMLQSYIELRNAQQIWLDNHNEGKPYKNILDKDGEEYHIATTKWTIEDIEKITKHFKQGLGSDIVKQASHQRQKSGVTPPEGYLESNNED